MQRKNGVLKRNGMAMIMAIIVIVIVSTTLAVSLRLSSQTTQRTTDLYLYEQSAVLSRSAAEYAMLRLSQSGPCNLSNQLNFRHNDTYDINISMNYIPATGTPCDANATAQGAVIDRTSNASYDGISLDGTVIMDVTVTANPDGTTEPIRYFRRSIQKL